MIFDLEFDYLLLPNEIRFIKKETQAKCYGLCLDDDTLHEINRNFYQHCDALIVNGNLPKYKYESYGYNAFNVLPLELPVINLTSKLKNKANKTFCSALWFYT